MSYAKLKGRIKEIFGTQSAFSDAMDLDPSTISAKLNGGSGWTREEMERACDILSIPIEEVYKYFFAAEVGKSQHEGE